LGLNLLNGGDFSGLVRTAGFRHLLATGAPVAVDTLASTLGCPADRLAVALDELDGAGRIRRNEGGRVVGSAGLSVIPDRHQIELDRRKFWTWCAYDILGIFGATRSTGIAWSRSPATGAMIELHFTAGQPAPSGAVLFRPSDSLAECCTSVYEEWCPNSNLFEDKVAARDWSVSHGLEGRVLNLDEASELATGEWLPLFGGGAF
jgi:alkylmercury lyase